MTSTEIMLQFTTITFPVFVGLPTFVGYFVPWPTYKIFGFIATLYVVAFIDLWISVILGCCTLWLISSLESWLAMVTLAISAILLSIALVYLAWFLSEHAMERVSEHP